MTELLLQSSLNIDRSVKFGVRRGPTSFSKQTSTASSVSNSSLIFDFQLNGSQNIIDPFMYMSIPIEVTITGPDLGNPLGDRILSGGVFALRSWPLTSCTTSSVIQINNQSISYSPLTSWKELVVFQKTYQESALKQSLSPVMPDFSQNYADLIASNRNPLNDLTESGPYYEGRGAFNDNFEILTNTNTQLTFRTTIHEPVVHPLLNYEPTNEKMQPGYIFCNQFITTLSLTGNLNRMFSANLPAINISTMSVNIQQNAALNYYLLSRPQNLLPPNASIRGFTNIITNQSQSLATVLPGQEVTIQSSTLSLSNVPLKIYVYVKRSNVDLPGLSALSLTDSWLKIEGVSMLFDNKTSLLGNFSEDDLHLMSIKEGICYSVQTMKSNVGSVLCIDSAYLGLSETMAPGMITQGPLQLQIQVRCRNISSQPITNVSCYVTTSIQQVFTILSNGEVQVSQGVLTPGDILTATESANTGVSYMSTNEIHSDVWGGSIGSFFKNLGKKALSQGHQMLKDSGIVSSSLRAVPVIGNIAGDVAENLGYGRMTKRMLARRGAGALRY
jgi:hypothetical protein